MKKYFLSCKAALGNKVTFTGTYYFIESSQSGIRQQLFTYSMQFLKSNYNVPIPAARKTAFCGKFRYVFAARSGRCCHRRIVT